MATEATGRPRLALLPSPLLGSAVWKPVGERLAERGWEVVVPPAIGEVRGPQEVLDRLLEHLPAGGPLVLVPHSNAGLYVAALAAARDVRGVVFVDAAMPSPGDTTPTAPAPFREVLDGLADADGLLPVWTSWWSTEDVSDLFPDAATRAAVEAEQIRLPLAYFDGVVASPPGWAELPGAYLAFGETYAEERARALAHGWPTVTLAGRHLHLLVDPETVATVLLGLVGQMGLLRT